MSLRPTTLVLSSGGVRGVAHVGALRALYRAGWLGGDDAGPRTVVGTSAGAVVGALVVLGYTPDEMWRVVRRTNLLSLLRREQRRLTLSGVLASLATRFGAIESATAELEGLLRTLVARSRVADGDADLTFGELRRRTGRTLVVCATDLVTAGPVYFGPATTPDTSVAYAVRASAAIPLVFTPVGGRYTDGALVDHYPFRRSPDDACRTLGVVLVDGDAPRADGHCDAPRDAPREPPRSLLDYVAHLVRAVETSRTRALLDDDDVSDRTIAVYCPRETGATTGTGEEEGGGASPSLRRVAPPARRPADRLVAERAWAAASPSRPRADRPRAPRARPAPRRREVARARRPARPKGCPGGVRRPGPPRPRRRRSPA